MNFDTKKEYTLENERVLLRPLQPDDEAHLMEFAINEPELWTYSLLAANGVKNMQAYLKIALSKRAEGDSYPYLVYDKLAQKYAGSTRFYDIQHHHNTLQLGYTWYGAAFQGTGLNKHCKFLMLQFAFEELEVDRVEFRADAKNARSIAAMKSIGCTYEGILRSNCASPGGRRDSIIFSMLKEEWQPSIKPSLLSKL